MHKDSLQGQEGVKSRRAITVIINISVLPSAGGFICTVRGRRGGEGSKYKSLFDLFLTNFLLPEV